MLIRRLSETGDTILEVLICVAVVGAVLAGAYRSANQSFASSRRSQERGEALRLVETQLERLKTVADDPTKALTYLDGSFCLDLSLAKKPTSDPECNDVSGRYDISITRTSSGSPNFTILTQWDAFGRSGQDQIQINYQVYQQ